MPTDEAILLFESSIEDATLQLAPNGESDNKEEDNISPLGIDIAFDDDVSLLFACLEGIGIGTELEEEEEEATNCGDDDDDDEEEEEKEGLIDSLCWLEEESIDNCSWLEFTGIGSWDWFDTVVDDDDGVFKPLNLILY